MPVKTSKLGVKPNSIFDERTIGTRGVYDEISGRTVEEHINDDSIHLNADDLSRVAITGSYKDLKNTPDLNSLVIDCGAF